MNDLAVTSLVVLWVVVLLHIFLTLALLRRVVSGPARKIETLRPGETAPAFSGEAVDGGSVSLESYRGKELLLSFMSPSCSNCRISLAQLKELRPIFQTAGIESLIVCRAGLEAARTWARDVAEDIPVFADTDREDSVTQAYKTPGTPAYCLISQDGKVRSAGFMAPDFEEWKALVERWKSDSTEKMAAAGA